MNGEPSVRLRELTLAGFGIYERPTRFLFPDGPAVFVGPNETGKSTLLWGLAAVWFGLPGVSDPGKPGTGRFRSLRGGDEFWGELSWQRGPRLFRLHRRFEAHRVRLTAERDGRTRVLFEGEHNPQGRSSAGTAFPPVLDRWLGVTSLELFLQTFCLMQPLPDSRGIGEELQHLISGSRSGRVDDVLAGLFAQVKVLTRATGDLGLRRPGTSRPTNQRDSGRIEQLEAALVEARTDLAQGEKRLKELNAGNEELEHAQAELERIAGERREHEERLATLSLWMQKNRERKERLEKVTLFRRTLEELDRLETERKRAESELSERFAAYREPPDDLESLLESLEEADAARERAETRLREWTETRGRREAEARDLEKRLETEFGDLGERSDWPGLWRRLSEASARREKRAREIEGLGTEIRRLEEGTKDPGSTPRPGVEVLRAQARGLLDAVGRIDWIEERLRDCDARLEEKRFLGSEGRLERLRESVELEGALRKCSEALREQRDAIALAEERTRTAESEWERERLRAESAARRAQDRRSPLVRFLRAVTRPIAAGLISIAAGAGLVSGLHAGLLVALPGALLLFAALVSIGRRLPRAPRGPEPPPGRRNSPEEATAGRTAVDAGTLVATEDDRGMATGAIPLSDTETLDEQRRRLEKLRAEERRLETRIEQLRLELGPYAQTTAPQLAKMEERWQILAQQIESQRIEWKNVLEERFEEAKEGWRETPLRDAPEPVRRLLVLPGAPGADAPVGDLLGWLAARDEETWQGWAAAERDRGAKRSELEAKRTRRDHLVEEQSDDAEFRSLEESLQPFSLETDLEELERRCRARDELTSQLKVLRADDEDERAELERARERSSTEVEVAWSTLHAVWPQERPERDLAGWARGSREQERAARELRRKVDGLRRSAETVLRSVDAATRSELEQRATLEGEALGSVVREIESLETQNVLLATTVDHDDPSIRALRLGKLATEEERRLAEAKEEGDRFEGRIRELLREKASLEGAGTPNLAALEIRFREMKQELESRRKEKDAIVQAFRWVETAAEDFQSAYRERLETRISEHLAVLTADPRRRVEVGDRFEVAVQDADGRPLAAEQLSQGTRDQLVLAIRLALGDLLSGAVPLPFFFDDPFLHFDQERLDRLRESLGRLSRERQWVLLTHRREFAEWGEAVFTEAAGTEPARERAHGNQ